MEERKEEEKAAVVSSPLLSFSVQTVSPPFKREWEGERRGLEALSGRPPQRMTSYPSFLGQKAETTIRTMQWMVVH